MEQFATVYGLPGAVILFLISLLAWTYRRIVAGLLVSDKIYDALKEDRDTWRTAAQELLAQNTELVTDKDLSVELLRALRAYAAAKRGEEL